MEETRYRFLHNYILPVITMFEMALRTVEFCQYYLACLSVLLADFSSISDQVDLASLISLYTPTELEMNAWKIFSIIFSDILSQSSTTTLHI